MICFTDDELWQIEQEYMHQYETWQDEEDSSFLEEMLACATGSEE